MGNRPDLRYALALERRGRAMRDIELYRAILGLTQPWTVVRVDLDVKQQEVVVTVDASPGDP